MNNEIKFSINYCILRLSFLYFDWKQVISMQSFQQREVSKNFKLKCLDILCRYLVYKILFRKQWKLWKKWIKIKEGSYRRCSCLYLMLFQAHNIHWEECRGNMDKRTYSSWWGIFVCFGSITDGCQCFWYFSMMIVCLLYQKNFFRKIYHDLWFAMQQIKK